MNKRKLKKSKYMFAAVLFVLAIIMLSASLVINNVRPPDTEEEIVRDERTDEAVAAMGRDHRENFFTMLVVGIDAASNSTDTIMLVSLDIDNSKMGIMSIPRDTITNTARSNKKINSTYIANHKDIYALYSDIEDITGIIPDKYALVTVDGFVELIDEIGGVEVDVPIDMIYEDPTQDLKINIKKGYQKLDGYDAMGFMRYRKTYAEGDIGRIKVQHTFIEALIKKMLKPSTFVKIPEIAKIISRNVETDLTLGNQIWIGKKMLSMNLEEDVKMLTLPGYAEYYEGLSYYFPSESEILSVVNESFNPYTTEISRLNLIKKK